MATTFETLTNLRSRLSAGARLDLLDALIAREGWALTDGVRLETGGSPRLVIYRAAAERIVYELFEGRDGEELVIRRESLEHLNLLTLLMEQPPQGTTSTFQANLDAIADQLINFGLVSSRAEGLRALARLGALSLGLADPMPEGA